MEIAKTVEEVRRAVSAIREGGHPVGFVPTMGALHEGHLSLVRFARRRGASVVVSVFVNPRQFGQGEDFGTYPRDRPRDLQLAEEAGASVFFAPSVPEIYPDGFATTVRVKPLEAGLCGRVRSGHFEGVATVVATLLNIVRPDFSVFGEKDAQQALIVKRLAADLRLPGRILTAPTVRESDGLAMSSRNAYLSPEERHAAAAIPRGIRAAEELYASGERSAAQLVSAVRSELAGEPLLSEEYVEIVDNETIGPWPGGDAPALLAVAVGVGAGRLIDNVSLGSAVADGDGTGEGS
ncbi:MAG: pantoate--beta-alanine ligase [Gemmatimonadota bacterium]|nr:pantoate--beta-alanine ligase [Gemmatimonadota bacterium]MDP6802795.1 pantoate--beta-alanine ligase [Gemmatimonadota bacterium]MDP7032724.1 pantoate--beta-alanine ligase [Gemmatimonadota bacterium]